VPSITQAAAGVSTPSPIAVITPCSITIVPRSVTPPEIVTRRAFSTA
jgi:hypothetical protein